MTTRSTYTLGFLLLQALVLLLLCGGFYLYKKHADIKTNKGVFLVGTTYDSGDKPVDVSTRVVVQLPDEQHPVFVIDDYTTAKLYSVKNKLLATFDAGNVVIWTSTVEVASRLIETRKQLSKGSGVEVEKAMKILDRIDECVKSMENWRENNE